MPLIPSENLLAALNNSRSGLWVEKLVDRRVALVCKATTSAIKAAYRGVSCSIMVSVIKGDKLRILCFGLRIQDEPENPYTVIQSCIFPTDLDFLAKSTSIALYFFDELSHPVLDAWCYPEQDAARSAIDGLNSAAPFSLVLSNDLTIVPGDVLRDSDLALDLFQKEVYRGKDDKPGGSILMSQTIPLRLELQAPSLIFEVSPTSQIVSKLDENEGKMLERALYVSLDAVYPGRTFLSPTIQHGKSRRELTDVLSFDPDADCICLIESKVMSVLHPDWNRPSKRRSASIKKQIEKALSQLCGGITQIRAGEQICDDRGAAIVIPNQKLAPIHAIVVLSEMYFFLDWQQVAIRVIELTHQDRYRAFFHVLDLQELRYLVAHTGNAQTFNDYLIQRWAGVKVKGTAYGRVQVPSEFPRDSFE